MTRRAGFTLLEALFSLLIFSIVLSALAYSLAQLSRVSLARKDFGLELEVLQIAQLLRADARNAARSDLSPQSLTFLGQNYNTRLDQRLEAGLNSTFSGLEVKYEFREGWLFRKTSGELASAEEVPVNQLQDFAAEQDGPLATVTLSIEKLNRLQTFKVRLVLP